MFTLDRLTPFNQCFYYNCVHSCLFSIIEANDGDFRKIMLSGVPHYTVDNNTQRIYTEFDFLYEYDKLLLEQGIVTERISHIEMSTDECIEYAINCLYNSKPIIINVDCYELPYRKDLFHKGEWPHSLLVCGFDNITESFRVIDQPTRESMEFKTFYISKSALKAAVRCYNKKREMVSMYFGDMIASFDCRISGKLYDANTLFIEWKECRKRVSNHIEEGNMAARNQLEVIMNGLGKEEFRCQYGEIILDGLNDIVKQKRWENFLIKELRPETDFIFILQSDLFQNWILLRKKIALIILSSKKRKKTEESIRELVDTVFKLEDAFVLAMGE